MFPNNLNMFVNYLNKHINDYNQEFNEAFKIKIYINIEKYTKFKKGFCGALTGNGCQCSRKAQKDSKFCGLHRCDGAAHRRKRNKTINFLTAQDNIYKHTYIISCKVNKNIINYNHLISLYYNNKDYFLDSLTNNLYKKVDDKIIKLGDFNDFNIDFNY